MQQIFLQQQHSKNLVLIFLGYGQDQNPFNSLKTVTSDDIAIVFDYQDLSFDESLYQDLSKPENFVYLCKSMHEVIHVIWRYYKNDPSVLDRIKEVLDRMLEINSPPPFEKENN